MNHLHCMPPLPPPPSLRWLWKPWWLRYGCSIYIHRRGAAAVPLPCHATPRASVVARVGPDDDVCPPPPRLLLCTVLSAPQSEHPPPRPAMPRLSATPSPPPPFPPSPRGRIAQVPAPPPCTLPTLHPCVCCNPPQDHPSRPSSPVR